MIKIQIKFKKFILKFADFKTFYDSYENYYNIIG